MFAGACFGGRRQNSAKLGKVLAKFGPNRTDAGQSLPKLASHLSGEIEWTRLGRPTLVRLGSISARDVPRGSTELPKVRPVPAELLATPFPDVGPVFLTHLTDAQWDFPGAWPPAIPKQTTQQRTLLSAVFAVLRLSASAECSQRISCWIL